MVQSRRAKFFAKYKRQSFSLPDSYMFYIAMNPSSSEVYQKMIESCKYFYLKNPILVISKFSYHGDGKWVLSRSKRRSDFSQITSKFWITGEVFVEHENSVKGVNQNFLSSSLMPKLYKCDAKALYIEKQIFSFHDLSLLISFAEDITFKNVTVKIKNGTNVAVEKIVEVAVNAKNVLIHSVTSLSNITSETMKELLKISNFSKLDTFILNGVPEAYDLETFYCFMKKNVTTKIWLIFGNSVSEAYKNRLEEIVDEILTTLNHANFYKTPLVFFDGLGFGKWKELHKFFSSSY